MSKKIKMKVRYEILNFIFAPGNGPLEEPDNIIEIISLLNVQFAAVIIDDVLDKLPTASDTFTK